MYRKIGTILIPMNDVDDDSFYKVFNAVYLEL